MIPWGGVDFKLFTKEEKTFMIVMVAISCIFLLVNCFIELKERFEAQKDNK